MMLSKTKDAIKEKHVCKYRIYRDDAKWDKGCQRNMFVNRGYRDDAKWDKGCQ